ncbi:MAG: patatin-like phospholipase family protein [Cyclobacteriaceae bacterium]|nr:patatin-like phospholipase family protein [Cyclobacteriaceae bacterium]
MESSTIDLKIGLAFSGGGYRAACFCLGTLSYLNETTLFGKPLREHVVALSTVSGGTITGAAYAVGIKQGKSFDTIYETLYSFMNDTDLVSLGLDRLLSNEGWKRNRIKSLINAFADVYNKELFKGSTFGTLMTDSNPIHLKHISFNATEFSNALQFRFQWSDKITKPAAEESPRGIIGNKFFRIPEEAASEIRMGDILAASSCFPGGFEPINFPSDFQYEGSSKLSELCENPHYRVGLMDGGIVDNQGIEPILLADQRMKRNLEHPDQQEHALDLIIVSDVASPYMEDYKQSTQHPATGWRKLSPAIILSINSVLLLTCAALLYLFITNGNTIMIIVSTAIATLSILLFLLGRLLNELPIKFNVPEFFLKPFGKLLRLKLQVYETMISNRKNSLLKMTNEVFLKHVRRLNYNRIYNDESWKNRRMMNAIYELRKDEKGYRDKIQEKKIPEYLMPSAKVQEVATVASSMSTTLWFTRDELEKMNMLNTIITCGQFTTCWNLLEYLEGIKRNNSNTNPNHASILQLEEKLKSHWMSFQEDPFWLVEVINKRSGVF